MKYDFSNVKGLDDLNRVLPGIQCNLSPIGNGAYVGYPAGIIFREFGIDTSLLPRIVGAHSETGLLPSAIPAGLSEENERVLSEIVRACHTVLLNSIK